MPDQPNDTLSLHFESQGLDLAQQVDAQLQLVAPDSPNRPLYREMLLTVLRMAHDDFDRWNAKITLQAIRELEKLSAFWSLSKAVAKSLFSARPAPLLSIHFMRWRVKWAQHWHVRT